MVICYAYYCLWLFIELIKSRPEVVHACDLDTVLPCYLYKLLFRKKLVFDVFDRYAMTFVSTKSKKYYSAINLLEEFFSKRANVLITISKEVLCSFRKRPKHCVIIMNCPEDRSIEKEKPNEHSPLTIVYTGSILRNSRGLEDIVTAIKGLTNVELVIAGWYMESDKEFLDQIFKIPNVKFKGPLKPNDTLALEAASDVMIALYNPEILWHNITLPNKLFEAMMCGIPLITNVAPNIVNEAGFGIIVKYNDIEQIKDAIITLRDDIALRHSLGANGRKAFLEKYNWSKMECVLFKVYEDLLRK
jgi:glycosyltransferase involved in cell wall biosynthesis